MAPRILTLVHLVLIGIVLLLMPGCDINRQSPGKNYDFSGTVSMEVLNNYLSRAVTHQVLFTDNDEALLSDDIRMFTEIGAKFIGRASIVWETPADLDAFFEVAASIATRIHAADDEIVLQAGLFEIIDRNVEQLAIPYWVFTAFGREIESRNYDYESMLYPNQSYVDFYDSGISIPDISQLETRMWYFHRAARYIDSGYEALHFGIADVIAENDTDRSKFADLLDRIRAYAGKNARRHLVLCDVHHPTGWIIAGRTIFDFLSYPLRIQEKTGRPFQGELRIDAVDAIYGRPLGGITPSGWSTPSLPYLVEFDNWGSSGSGGSSIGGIWVWGWDEICWFARQNEAERNDWLSYAFDWVEQNTTHGHIQFPTRRVLADPIDDRLYWYSANNESAACENGFNQEERIREIWSRD